MRKAEYEKKLRRALKIAPEDKPAGLDQKNEELRAAGKPEIPWPPAMPDGLEDFFDRADITLSTLYHRSGLTPEAQALLLFMFQELQRVREELSATDGVLELNSLRRKLKDAGIPWRECMKYGKESATAKLVELEAAAKE